MQQETGNQNPHVPAARSEGAMEITRMAGPFLFDGFKGKPKEKPPLYHHDIPTRYYFKQDLLCIAESDPKTPLNVPIPRPEST